MFFIERGRLSQPLLYLSAFIEAHRQEYYDLLQRVCTHGDWDSWLVFFLNGVKETSEQAIRKSGTLTDLREDTAQQHQVALEPQINRFIVWESQ
jgi:Fic family protein